MEVKGDGQAALLNLSTATGVPLTQDGFYGYGTTFFGNVRRNIYDIHYSVNAPYASLNYHVGKLAIGGSLRYDFGTARGNVFGSADLGRAGHGQVVRRQRRRRDFFRRDAGGLSFR
ncbi:MAG: hypothetical protein QM756_20300 [Polyangiaceae bacterium]